jgi:hypothetical protein
MVAMPSDDSANERDFVVMVRGESGLCTHYTAHGPFTQAEAAIYAAHVAQFDKAPFGVLKMIDQRMCKPWLFGLPYEEDEDYEEEEE